jgi:hypothetical protein
MSTRMIGFEAREQQKTETYVSVVFFGRFARPTGGVATPPDDFFEAPNG